METLSLQRMKSNYPSNLRSLYSIQTVLQELQNIEPQWLCKETKTE